jgi:tetratricopeptide (TPR) repeat protein
MNMLYERAQEMGFLNRLFRQQKKDKSLQNLENYLGTAPSVEAHGKRFVAIDSEDESIPKRIGEATGIQFIEDSAIEHIQKGKKYKDQERYQDAIREYKSAITIEPHAVDAHHFLAITYLSMEHFDQALKEFKTTLRIAEQFMPQKGKENAIVMIIANICTLIKKRGKSTGFHQGAVEDFMEAVNILKDPPPMYHCALGMLYEELHLKAEAIRQYEELLSIEKAGVWPDFARERIKDI